jgi:hypothetical protein
MFDAMESGMELPQKEMGWCAIAYYESMME